MGDVISVDQAAHTCSGGSSIIVILSLVRTFHQRGDPRPGHRICQRQLLEVDGIVADSEQARDGRKIVATANVDFEPHAAPTPLQQALTRGYRWLAMLESGAVKSLNEVAAREGVCSSYVSRMVNLTTLAPDMVAAILDDALASHITLFKLAVDPPHGVGGAEAQV